MHGHMEYARNELLHVHGHPKDILTSSKGMKSIIKSQIAWIYNLFVAVLVGLPKKKFSLNLQMQ